MPRVKWTTKYFSSSLESLQNGSFAKCEVAEDKGITAYTQFTVYVLGDFQGFKNWCPEHYKVEFDKKTAKKNLPKGM
jgi:hypothetical protein